MKKLPKFIFGAGKVLLLLFIFGCNPNQPGNDPGNTHCALCDDNTGPGVPCHPDVVYYEKDIQPILNASCAYSPCHSANDAADGVILDNYQNTLATGGVEPGDPGNSELWEVLVDDPEDIMPPAPSAPLPPSQIRLVEKWIEQGAKNLVCDGGCDLTNITYANTIAPIIVTNCQGCHSGANPSGNLPLTNYAEVKRSVDDGSFMGTVLAIPPYNLMPPAGRMPQCEIDKLEAWISSGAPNS